MTDKLRALIVTRFSTDMQSDNSERDQERECRQLAHRLGATVVVVVNDPATSGTKDNRVGLNKARALIEGGGIDVILAEGLDRISRDQEHIARFFKFCTFYGVAIHTTQEGEVSELHVGLKGTMNALFLKDLRIKVRRGMVGRVTAGFSGGGKAYGYDIDQTPNGTLFKINATQAKHVRFVFEKFAEGRSTRWIADDLNRRGVPSPTGGKWGHTTIYGDSAGRGFLCNELYRGWYVWGKTVMVVDPASQRRTWRPVPAGRWHRVEMPHCRIIDDATWNEVKRRQQRNFKASAERPTRSGPGRGPKYLYSGLLKCGVCGGSYVIVDQSSYGCGTHRDRGKHACANNQKIARKVVEARITEAVTSRLFGEDDVRRFREDIRRRLVTTTSHGADVIAGLRASEKRLSNQIERLLANIENGIGDPTIMGDRMRDRVAERDGVRAQIAAHEASAKVIDLLPAVMAKRATVIDDLRALAERDVHAARERLRDLLGGRITIFPDPQRNVVAVIRGHMLGLLKALDDAGTIRFLLARAPARLTDFQSFVVRLRDIVATEADDGDTVLQAAIRDRAVYVRSLSRARQLKVVAEEGLEPPTNGL